MTGVSGRGAALSTADISKFFLWPCVKTHRGLAASVARWPLFVSLSCSVFEEWKTGKSVAFTWWGNVLRHLSQEMCSLEGIPVGWMGCSWHDWVNKGPSIVLNCTAALLLPSPLPCIPFFCYLFYLYCQVKCFSGCELKPAWTSGLRQIFQSSLGNWCCFPGELSRELSAFAVLFLSSPIRPKHLLLMGALCWGACWQSAEMPPNWALQLTCCYPGKVRLWLSAMLFPLSFPPLPFLFFLFRQWAVWEKEMPLIMYIQHLSQWESYHKTRNQSEKKISE